MDGGAFTDLAALHKRLDEAVALAYGPPMSVARTRENWSLASRAQP